MKNRSLAITAVLGSLIIHVLVMLGIYISSDSRKFSDLETRGHQQTISMIVNKSGTSGNTGPELKPSQKPSAPVKTGEKQIRRLARATSKNGQSQEKTSTQYSDLLPKGSLENTADSANAQHSVEENFSYDVVGKDLQPAQEREVSYFVNSVQIPLAVRRDYREVMSCQLHLVLSGEYLHLRYLSGSPFLRAEIYDQFETGMAVRNFAGIMEKLKMPEMYFTVDLRSLGSPYQSNSEYRTHLEGNRLRIAITQIYRDADGIAVGIGNSGGSLGVGFASNISDKFVRRQEELSAFYGRELTKSPAFRQVIRNKKYLVQR